MTDILQQSNVADFARPLELDNDEIVFDDVERVDNPLAAPLVSALRRIRALCQRRDEYREALKAAIELLHTQDRELFALKKRNVALIDELRALQARGRAA